MITNFLLKCVFIVNPLGAIASTRLVESFVRGEAPLFGNYRDHYVLENDFNDIQERFEANKVTAVLELTDCFIGTAVPIFEAPKEFNIPNSPTEEDCEDIQDFCRR